MKHLILISILLFTAVSIWVIKIIGRKSELSISLHVSQRRRTKLVFAAIVTIASIVVSIALFAWLLPDKYDVGARGYFIYTFIALDLLIIGLIPHVEGNWRGKLHNLAAWGIVYVIPVAMLEALSWRLSSTARIVTTSLAVINFILLALVLFQREKYRPVFLYFQTGYLAMFSLFLLAIAYL